MDRTALMTEEKISAYRQEVLQMEHRRAKLRLERRCADLAGGAAFFLAALAAIYSMADMLEMPVFPGLQFLAGPWKRLCAVFLPWNSEPFVYFLFSVLAATMIALAVHLLAALAVELSYPGALPAPPEGGEAQRAEQLRDRCKAAGERLPPRRKLFCVLVSAAYALLVLAPTFLDLAEMQAELRELGPFEFAAAVALVFVVFTLFYLVPYAFFLWLSGLLYRIRPQSSLVKRLDEYADLCRTREEERARAEEERRLREQAERDRRQGDELYRQAIAGDRVDEELVWQAAELGCRPACLYLGRQMMEAWAAGSYTKEEKADIAEVAKRYFCTAAQEENFPESRTEAEFGYLTFRCLTESGNAAKWRGVLARLRDIRSSGLLPERYFEPCDVLIDTVVGLVDEAAVLEVAQQPDAPVVKRCYCKFFNAGVCGWYSSGDYLAKCDHVSSPGQCSAALMNNGLGFEFE